MRNLATVRVIKEVRPIKDADSIELAIVDGWECVVAKKDAFKEGDKVVYIEIDSIMPDRPEYEFLRQRKFRVRTIKLRGQVSQGLVLPMTVLPSTRYDVGDDVTDILGVKKYDPQAEQEQKSATQKAQQSKNPLIKFLMRFKWFRKFYVKPKKGGFPSWIVKTDEERIQNKEKMFEIERDLGTVFSATEKIDGQSVTFFLEKIRKNKFDFGVCSRNLRLKVPDNSSWWTVAKQINAEWLLKKFAENHNRVVLQGEIIGTGIQGNKYKIDGYEFRAFNFILDGVKYSTSEIRKTLSPFGIKTVDTVCEDYKLPENIHEIVEFAKGKSIINPKLNREGLVFRNYQRDISFKVINPDFLLKEEE